jgi:hypothetical protein
MEIQYAVRSEVCFVGKEYMASDEGSMTTLLKEPLAKLWE